MSIYKSLSVLGIVIFSWFPGFLVGFAAAYILYSAHYPTMFERISYLILFAIVLYGYIWIRVRYPNDKPI